MTDIPLIDPSKRVAIPVLTHPLFRTAYAIQRGVEKNLLLRTWGGIGDQICAEPTLRYALKMFKDCDISLASELPELFRHLEFKKVFDTKEVHPNYSKFFTFDTITPPDESNLVWCFMSHMMINCVDFPSQCAFRLQLPVQEKDIRISPRFLKTSPHWRMVNRARQHGILIHPGKHWQSKTFPASFWNGVIREIIKAGVIPVVIGANAVSAGDNTGTVDVDATDCMDLRDLLTVEESAWLCMNAKVLLTNDSSPLHMAAAGRAWIGYIATCKHPDMITHWRNLYALTTYEQKNAWNWREVNFSKGGVWDVVDFCPNNKETVEAEFVDPDLLASWLPDPAEYAAWAVEKFKETDVVKFTCDFGVIS